MNKATQFKKGHKGLKPKGAISQKTKQWEELGEAITTRHSERFNQILENLEDDKFADRYLNVLEYFKPKQSRTAITDSEGNNLATPVIYFPKKDS